MSFCSKRPERPPRFSVTRSSAADRKANRKR
uniref:Uncharacterized protein n=1 Tax=Human herpesvirus 2 TaxID=10310 RepID=A0A481TD43_HHV2|nr:hypothetical protein [Human alphaherpesvirus 2]QBH85190.1 hypothetical protein [Human alphaherpesvirus 2]QBH85347.1 hypothetical protein [Human alphaherpesvirus 2]